MVLLCLVATGACGRKAPGTAPVTLDSQVKLTLTGTGELNNCGKSAPLPLKVKVVQVSNPGVMEHMTLERLWNHEGPLLAPLAEPDTLTLNPGRTREYRARFVNGAKAVVVLGGFCKTDPNCPWYYVQTWQGHGDLTIHLTADANCLSVTPR